MRIGMDRDSTRSDPTVNKKVTRSSREQRKLIDEIEARLAARKNATPKTGHLLTFPYGPRSHKPHIRKRAKKVIKQMNKARDESS